MTIPTLLTPMKYVLVRHSSGASYNVILPGSIAIILTVGLTVWPGHAVIAGEKGYLPQLQNLMTILGGFFVAALTLITTNQNPVLLNPVGGISPPTLAGETKPLSRRRFLAYLFGYLAFSSFGLVCLSIAANLIAPAIGAVVSTEAKWWLKLGFLAIYNFWLGHVAVATLLGLFYFTERLQIADPVVKAAKPSGRPTPAE